jgi:alkanesulfonate monooxygenase SsuD/methylene tetrahydromethanopterin reductase-like flavin-dependent oxidoreductase (luciferase family)
VIGSSDLENMNSSLVGTLKWSARPSGTSCTASGSPETVLRGLEAFIARTGVDDFMVTSQLFDHQARLPSFEMVAQIAAESTS